MNGICSIYEQAKIENTDHFNLLRKIDKNKNKSQRELAKDLGFSFGKT